MERKTVHALLLSLAVVAGGVMMTTDAHAQTNTERLITTVDNTNSIMAALNSLADAVADGFAAVLAAIGMVQADTSTIMTEIGHVESELSTVHSEVEGIGSELSTVHSEVEDIGSNVASLDSSLQGISNDIAGLAGTVGGSAASFASLADTVQSNSVAINSLSEKLDMISEAVGAVQTTVETQEDVDPAVTNMLHSAETELAVAVADFAGTVERHPVDNVYEASNVFSCDGDVFLDTLAVSGVNPILNDQSSQLASLTPPAPALPKTTVSVHGFSLYETFTADEAVVAGSVIANIGKDRDFDNQFLSAGSTLVIKGSTDQSVDVVTDETIDPTTVDTTGATSGSAIDRNLLTYTSNSTANTAGSPNAGNVFFTIADYVELTSNKATIGAGTDMDARTDVNAATKADLGTVELYTVTVKWFAASSDTTCSITSAVETVSGLPNTDNTVLVALNLDEDAEQGPPTPFIAVPVDCNGEDTEITGISIQAGAIAGLNQFIEVELTAGGEPASVSFDTDNSADPDASDLPFRFSGSDVTFSGDGIGTLLLQVTYDTTKGNTCKVSN